MTYMTQKTWEAMMTVLKVIEGNPKCSIYGLSKLLGWSYGKTENYVKRLLSNDFITKSITLKRGRSCCELVAFPKEHWEAKG